MREVLKSAKRQKVALVLGMGNSTARLKYVFHQYRAQEWCWSMMFLIPEFKPAEVLFYPLLLQRNSLVYSCK